ncbi:MAG: primosomal protein N' [Geminicoccaceae bacterium]
MSDTVVVALPVPLDKVFHYRRPPGMDLEAGDPVEVPFGPNRLVGVVWHEAPPLPSGTKLKVVIRKFETVRLPLSLLHLLAKLAQETVSPIGSVIRLALSVPAALAPEPPRMGWRKATSAGEGRLTPARQKVLTVLEGGPPQRTSEIAALAGVSGAVVRGLADNGWLEAASLLYQPSALPLDPDGPGPVLSPQQQAATEKMLAIGPSDRVLLYGVPGAGKTEVYFEAIAAALKSGRQALVLLPEIALTAQWVNRFEARFGAPPLMWHSQLTSLERRRHWRSVASGEARVVVGARSALFLPLHELGLIIVDEEHDGSFKQEDGVVYHARDAALWRGELTPCPVILASATPSLESQKAAGLLNDEDSSMGCVTLPARHAGAAMPRVNLVDLVRNRPARGLWLAETVHDRIARTIDDGRQALVFLNRRGFAPLTICQACGHRWRCPTCSAWLVEHRFRERLTCHHCGYTMPKPEHCPSCGTLDAMVPAGPGIERIAEEIASRHPGARTALFSSDLPPTTDGQIALIEAMGKGEIDILIGTQIIAKGHHFPKLTLGVVVDADIGLGGGDPRAGERTYQLLYQVAGRTGRERDQGEVLVQTRLAHHPAMQALAEANADRFFAAEGEQRRLAQLPPYGRLAALIVSGRDQAGVRKLAVDLGRLAPASEGVRVLGPAPAPLALLRGRHRQRLLAMAGAEFDLPGWIRRWLAPVKPPGDLRISVDVDPISFL